MLQLRDYQREAIKSVYDYFSTENGNPLIVAPTGSGKSLIIAQFVKEVLETWPNQKIMILTHVQELIQQNFEEIKKIWPECPAGIYSSGLKKRQTIFPVTFGGIQSVYKKYNVFGYQSLIIIDEAHLLSPNADSMYRQFIEGIKLYNPSLKVIGLTATPFRTKGGMLTAGESRLFTNICYTIDIVHLIKNGYLAPLKNKRSAFSVDMTGVAISAGDFNQKQMQDRMDKEEITERALDDVFSHAGDRKSWLVFCSGVEHAEHVKQALIARGVNTEIITGETEKPERKAIIEDFKAGKIQALTSMGVLTTGFNAPNCDLLVILRATKSPGLWIQMCGRGMRLMGKSLEESIQNGKSDCLVLDYGGNIDRFGPINNITVHTGKEKKPLPKELTKDCPQCGEVVHINTIYCECGYTFPKEEKASVSLDLTHQASQGEIISERSTGFDEEVVKEVRYSRHSGKNGKPDSFKVTYCCPTGMVHEWICFEHEGYPKRAAVTWWMQRAILDGRVTIPATVAEALNRTDQLRTPRTIRTQKDGKFTKVVSAFDFQDPPIQSELNLNSDLDIRITG